MSENKNKQYNQFILEEIFPDSLTVLFPHPSISTIAENCLFVFDTNSLLVPYNMKKDCFGDIKKIYNKLLEEKRVFVPERVLREFVKNRQSKLSDIYSHLYEKISQIPSIPEINCPLLEEMSSYSELLTSREKLKKQIKDYSSKLNSLFQEVKGLNWNDPVSVFYSEIFKAESIIKPAISQDEMKDDLENRILHTLPPAYKDKTKKDVGIGDIIIWHSILNLGQTSKSDIIFVSNDEKADWVVRSQNKGLFARYELVEEFRTKTESKNFVIINFSQFIELMGASKDTVTALKESEDKQRVEISQELLSDAATNLIVRTTSKSLGEKINSTDVEHCLNELKTGGWGIAMDFELGDPRDKSALTMLTPVRPAEDDGSSWFATRVLTPLGEQVKYELQNLLKKLR